jgi:hypothetical protein
MGARLLSGFDFPDGTPLVDDNKRPTLVWTQVFTRWHRIILSVQQSGTTAQRPDTLLWLGRRYFDTDLGIPVWVQSVGPVVWCDATGAPA